MLHTYKICLYSPSHTFHKCKGPGDNIIYTFPCTCSPGSHIFLVIAVHHITVELVFNFLFKYGQVSPPFGYMNSTPIGHKSFES